MNNIRINKNNDDFIPSKLGKENFLIFHLFDKKNKSNVKTYGTTLEKVW